MVNLSVEQKNAVITWYCLEAKNERGLLLPGRVRRMADEMHCSVRTVQSIVKKYKDGVVPILHGQPRHNVIERGHLVSGLTDDAIIAMYEVAQNHIDDQIHCTDKRLRNGMADLGFNHSLSTIQRWRKKLNGTTVSTYIKPSLSAEQKQARIDFVNGQKEIGGMQYQHPRNKLHIDETWYYLDKTCKRYLVFPGQEVDDNRVAQHRSHIKKVMMITVIGYPQHRPDGSYFDGKIGSWPVVEHIPAARNSINRPRGTIITTVVPLTSEKYVSIWTQHNGIRDMIRQKMRHHKNTGIIIQQDGAPPHTGNDSVNVINEYIQRGHWNCNLINQCPQSPDVNILDLGLFRGMKSAADAIKGDGRNIDT